MITVVLKETKKTVTAKVNEGLAGLLNKTLRRKRGAIIRDIRALVPRWIKSQPEMIDLSTNNGVGSLASQFGLEFGTSGDAVEAITLAVVNSVSIDISKISKKDLSGGVKMRFMPATFKDLLELPEGHVIYEDGDLHWLSWLLLEGFKVIVVGHSFRFAPGGRSGGGTMKKGGIWRVPPQFAGSREDNFITRALNNPVNEREIQRVFERHIR